MNILVTGGAGYIGTHLVPLLLEGNHNVTVVDDLSNTRDVPADEERLRVELLGCEEFADNFDVIIHLAGRICVGDKPSLLWQANVAETLGMLANSRAKKIIVASSAAVYGEGYIGRGLREDDNLDPASVYGRTKVALEQLVTDCFPAEVTILRLFNVAGGRERHLHETHILPLALTGSVTVHGPEALTMVRDYVHVEDVAAAFVAAIDGPPGIYNIGTGIGTSTQDLLAEVAKRRSLNVAVGRGRSGDPSHLVADIGHARSTLGWQPTRELDAIIDSAWQKDRCL